MNKKIFSTNLELKYILGKKRRLQKGLIEIPFITIKYNVQILAKNGTINKEI